jgi:hypothetical protein
MIFALFLISVVTLEAILYRDKKRRRDQSPPERVPDDALASLRSLADAVGPSVQPHIETPVENGRRTDLH